MRYYSSSRGMRQVKLPNAHLAVVEQAKICEYLLNPAHRYGASKARFFEEVGFRPQAWEVLAVALRHHGRENESSCAADRGGAGAGEATLRRAVRQAEGLKVPRAEGYHRPGASEMDRGAEAIPARARPYAIAQQLSTVKSITFGASSSGVNLKDVPATVPGT